MSEKSNAKRSRSEMEHFNNIASRYVKKDLFAPSRIARSLRIRQTVSGIPDPVSSDILEIGCGAGYASEFLKGSFLKYTGIDFSEGLINIARTIHKGPGVEFYKADLYKYEPGKKFDLIIIIGVLHHMVDIPLALKICKKLLKPGGVIAVNEPQDSNILVGFVRKLRSRFDKTYSSDQEELDRKGLKKLFEQTGFADVRVKPQGFFSTPFAEVMMKPGFIFKPLSWLACNIDLLIEKNTGRFFSGLSWNIIVVGKNPEI